MTPREREIELEVAELDKQLAAVALTQTSIRRKREELFDEFRSKGAAIVQQDSQLLNRLSELVIISSVRLQMDNGMLRRTYALRKPACSYYDTVAEETLQVLLDTGALRKFAPKEWIFPATMKIKHMQRLSEQDNTWLCFTARGRMVKISSPDSSSWVWEELAKMDPKYNYFLCRNFKYDEYYIKSKRKFVKGEYHGRTTQSRQNMGSVKLLAVGRTKADMLEHVMV